MPALETSVDPPNSDIGVLIIDNPLFLLDGGLHMNLAGEVIALLMQAQPVPHFLPGWRASHLYTGMAPLFLLELVHDDGRKATWFLDHRMQHIGDAVERLTPEGIDLLRSKAVPVIAGLLRTTLYQCQPALSAESRAFLTLNEATKRAIAANCLDLVLRPPVSFLVANLAPASLLFRGESPGSSGCLQTGPLHAISRAHLTAGLDADFQDRLASAVSNGVLTWPSPVDGALLEAQGGFCFDDFHFAYRFADARTGLVFFVMVADHYSRIGGVWIPSLGILVSRDELTRGVARYMLRHLPYWFVTHSCQWAELLVPHLKRGPRRLASVMRGRPGVHIGHQLWNELSGIDHFLAARPPTLPEWIVLNASDGIELYGAIDALFPVLRGHVNRDLANIAALIQYSYEQDVMILRITREHVSNHLRRRILDLVHSRVAAGEAASLIARQRPALAILLGLRVENRTLCDLDGFFSSLVGFIVQRYPGAVLVLDGHNARGEAGDGKVIESHGESYAGRRPVDIEHELVSNLRARFRDEPVTIVSTIGAPIGVSLAWADQCDCFVSIWGASLAKYRWVCNKPGLVISSRSNLAHRGDLHIYDAPSFMESPTELHFASPDLITDRPEAPLLVDVAPGNPSFFNFDVDQALLFAQIEAMIEEQSRKGANRAGSLEQAQIAMPAAIA